MTRPGAPARPGIRPSTSSRLLSALPASTLLRLWPQLESVPLDAHDVIYQADETIQTVYFVESGLCSLMTITREGHGVEAASIGREGLLGLPVGLGAPSMPVETLVRVSGRALRMPEDAFRRELARDGILRDVVNRYANALLVHLLQSAACNRLHGLEERCCRWLLGASDRLRLSAFPVTQELLAAALGVRRPSLTLALRTLQRAGLISYRRGHVTILNRRRLEAASCECYAVVRTHLERVFRSR
jgi:CRP-like cAMP-binding protein